MDVKEFKHKINERILDLNSYINSGKGDIDQITAWRYAIDEYKYVLRLLDTFTS